MSVLPTGTGSMVRLILRRDRVRLPVWVVALVGLVAASAQAVQGVYDSEAERAAYAETVGGSPAAIIMSGPPTAVDTVGGITVFEVNLIAIVATALMALFLVVRHTRGEEEEGRTELVRAGVVGRFAPVTAAVLVVSTASVVVGAGIGLSMLGFGLPASGSLLYGAEVATVGITFTALGALAAQVTEHARGALGIGGTVLGVSFLVRGFGDIGDGTLSWASPVGWAQAVRAFGQERWWPLLLPLGLSVVLTYAAAVLMAHRDVGAGLVQARPGPPRAGRTLSGPLGLAARLQRGSLVGWTTGLFALGLTYGSFGREVGDLVESNPVFAELFGKGGRDTIVDQFFGYAVLTMAVLSGAFAVASALRLRSEESAGRAEPLLATGISRWRWALGGLVVTAAGSVVVLAAGGLGMAITHAVVSGDAGQLGRLTGAAVAYLPAVLTVAAVAVLLFGWLPRWSPAAWAFLAMCFVIGWLGPLLRLPEWSLNLSPFTHVPQAPAETLTATPLVLLAVVAVSVVALGLTGFRRRDLA